MKKNKRAFSADQRKPVVLDTNDPRAKYNEVDKYGSRLGREVLVTDTNTAIKLQKYVAPPEPPTYWISLYNKGPGCDLTSCVVDSQNNVYVAGAIGNFASYSKDIAGLIIKYDKNRNIVWGRSISSGLGGWTSPIDPSGGEVDIFDMQIDSSNNIYIIGNYKSGSKYNTFLAKYNQDGTLLFQRIIATQFDQIVDYYPRITIDLLGNIYATTSYSDGTLYALLLKYSSSGSLIWQKKISSEVGCSQAVITTDSNNNIIMCVRHSRLVDSGFGFSYIRYRFGLVKIDSNGSIISQVSFANGELGGFASTSYFIPLKIVCDSNNNVYVSMLTFANASLNADDHIQRPFLMKLNSSFTPIWQKAPAESGSTSWNSWADGLDVDSQGNVYWGVYRGLSAAIVYKLDSNGNQIFANNIFIKSDTSVYGINIKNSTLYVCGTAYDGPERLPYTFKIISDTSLLGSYPIANIGGYPSSYNFFYNALAISLKDIGYYVTVTTQLSIDAGSITESAGSFSPFSLTYGETGRYIP